MLFRSAGVTEASVNEYGRFDDLKKTVVSKKAEEYFVSTEGAAIPALQLNIKVDKLLKDFVISGGIDINED